MHSGIGVIIRVTVLSQRVLPYEYATLCTDYDTLRLLLCTLLGRHLLRSMKLLLT